MKSHVFSWFAGVICLVLIWGCEAETVAPSSTTSHSEQLTAPAQDINVHPTVKGVCADSSTFPLVDWSGNATVNYCGLIPCTGNQPDWGTVSAFHTTDRLYLEVDMAYGWYVQRVKSYIGDKATINVTNGIPALASVSLWEVQEFSPIINRGQVWHSTAPMAACFAMMTKVDVVKLDFFTGVDPASARELTVYNDEWNNSSLPATMRTSSPFICMYCAPNCGASTSLDQSTGSNF